MKARPCGTVAFQTLGPWRPGHVGQLGFRPEAHEGQAMWDSWVSDPRPMKARPCGTAGFQTRGPWRPGHVGQLGFRPEAHEGQAMWDSWVSDPRPMKARPCGTAGFQTRGPWRPGHVGQLGFRPEAHEGQAMWDSWVSDPRPMKARPCGTAGFQTRGPWRPGHAVLSACDFAVQLTWDVFPRTVAMILFFDLLLSSWTPSAFSLLLAPLSKLSANPVLAEDKYFLSLHLVMTLPSEWWVSLVLDGSRYFR